MMSLGLSSGSPAAAIHGGPSAADLSCFVGPALETCPTCRENVAQLERWMEETYYPDPAMVAEEVPRAEALWQEIQHLKGQELQRELEVISSSWVTVIFLVEQASEASHASTQRSLELAETAVSMAFAISEESYPPRLLWNLRALAVAACGNARRLVLDLIGAERDLDRALDFSRKGSGATRVRARILSFLGSLRRDQRRLSEGQDVLEQARDLYEHSGANRQAGEVCMTLAELAAMRDSFDSAVSHLTYAQQVIDRQAEPLLFAMCQHNLVANLVAAEHFEEARLRVGSVRQIWRSLGKGKYLAQAVWLTGKIEFGLQEFDRARTALLEASVFFDQQENLFGWALVQLDLALVYFVLGDLSSLKRVATEAFVVFRDTGVHREASAALLCLKEASEAEAATKALISEVASFLETSRQSPSLRFRAE